MSKVNSIDEELNSGDESSADGKRRTSYVTKDHKSMVDFVGEIYKTLGHADYHSNKAIATVARLSPSSIKQHLTSCQQYKLLEIKFGVGYKTTELFNKIYLPYNDIEKRNAVIESLKSPDTYQALFKEYEFHIVPPVTGIKNHFVRNYQFKEDIAEKAAETFIKNLKDYDLLDARGILISALPLKGAEKSDVGNYTKQQFNVTTEDSLKTTEQSMHPKEPLIQEMHKQDDGLFELPIPLPNRRKAYLRYPLDNLTRKDINVITKALEFIASSLEDE